MAPPPLGSCIVGMGESEAGAGPAAPGPFGVSAALIEQASKGALNPDPESHKSRSSLPAGQALACCNFAK
jgi:hypothetical protein